MAVIQDELGSMKQREASYVADALKEIQKLSPFVDWSKMTYPVWSGMLRTYAAAFEADLDALRKAFEELYAEKMVPPLMEHIMADRMAAAVKEMCDLSEYIDWKRCDDVHLNMFIAAVAALHGVSREELGNRFDNTF